MGPKETKLPSCGACKSARTKCERQPGETDCLRCIKKEILCAIPPKKPRKNPMAVVNRAGIRINLAKEVFGTRPDMIKPLGNVPFAYPNAQHERSMYSTVPEQLFALHLHMNIISSLLELYMDKNLHRNFYLEATDFRAEFDRVGRRIDQMSPELQVLCSLVVAHSARISNHPTVVGPNAPNLSQVVNFNALHLPPKGSHLYEHDPHFHASQPYIPLAHFGAQREYFCKTLGKQALDLADQKGVLKQPTRISLISLDLMAQLSQSLKNSALWTSEFSSYTSMFVVLAREILYDEYTGSFTSKFSVNLSPFSWNYSYKDAFHALFRGTFPIISEHDLSMIRKPGILSIRSVLDPGWRENCQVWIYFLTILNDVSETARGIAREKVSMTQRISAFGGSRSTDGIREIIKSLELILQGLWYSPEILYRFKDSPSGKLMPPGLPVNKQWSETMQDIRASIRSMGFACFVLGIKLGELVELHVDPASHEFNQLREEVRHILFNSTREIAKACKEMIDLNILPYAEGFVEGSQNFVYFSEQWISIFCQMNTSELGGPEGFSFRVKIQELEWMGIIMERLAWSFEEAGKWSSVLREAAHSVYKEWLLASTFTRPDAIYY